jgi:anhydro-N-acetylmuramic acid kinase
LDKNQTDKMRVLGVMSGTSLDGLDLALCEFQPEGSGYQYTILRAQTITYKPDQRKKLSLAPKLRAESYFALNQLFGKFIGEQINLFLRNSAVKPDAIASHGHTIFHQPDRGFSTQMGCGATIAAITGYTTVCDFRSTDIALGGQGAPLVPLGDRQLFAEYEACLNIGGIANISFEKNGQRIAHDICFANMALNFLAEKLGHLYDAGGKIASKGKTNDGLLMALENVLPPSVNSLSREGFEKLMAPVLESSDLKIEDKMASVCEYIANQIGMVLNKNGIQNVLLSGGGTYNNFLIRRIKNKYDGKVIIPDDKTIEFKESLVFAFLGYLRLNEKTNTLKSVTGAIRDSIGGAVYLR